MDAGEWADQIVEAARSLKDEKHKALKYDGLFPFLAGRGNCCTVVTEIIKRAGGGATHFRPKGVAPGLGCFSAGAQQYA